MRFYVAARFTEKKEVREIYKLLHSRGHKITTDWTMHKTIKPYDRNSETARVYAVEDMNGVMHSDIFILLTSENTGSGSAGELGAAIISQIKSGRPKIYVIGDHTENNLFYFHPTVVRKASVEEVLQEI